MGMDTNILSIVIPILWRGCNSNIENQVLVQIFETQRGFLQTFFVTAISLYENHYQFVKADPFKIFWLHVRMFNTSND